MVTRIQKAIEERAERRAKEIEDIKIEEDRGIANISDKTPFKQT